MNEPVSAIRYVVCYDFLTSILKEHKKHGLTRRFIEEILKDEYIVMEYVDPSNIEIVEIDYTEVDRYSAVQLASKLLKIENNLPFFIRKVVQCWIQTFASYDIEEYEEDEE